MKRLDDDGGKSQTIGIRLPQKTLEQLDALIAKMPLHPVGPPPRPMVIRAVIEAGIEALAMREGIKLEFETTTPPKPKASRRARAKKRAAVPEN